MRMARVLMDLGQENSSEKADHPPQTRETPVDDLEVLSDFGRDPRYPPSWWPAAKYWQFAGIVGSVLDRAISFL